MRNTNTQLRATELWLHYSAHKSSATLQRTQSSAKARTTWLESMLIGVACEGGRCGQAFASEAEDDVGEKGGRAPSVSVSKEEPATSNPSVPSPAPPPLPPVPRTTLRRGDKQSPPLEVC